MFLCRSLSDMGDIGRQSPKWENSFLALEILYLLIFLLSPFLGKTVEKKKIHQPLFGGYFSLYQLKDWSKTKILLQSNFATISQVFYKCTMISLGKGLNEKNVTFTQLRCDICWFSKFHNFWVKLFTKKTHHPLFSKYCHNNNSSMEVKQNFVESKFDDCCLDF